MQYVGRALYIEIALFARASHPGAISATSGHSDILGRSIIERCVGSETAAAAAADTDDGCGDRMDVVLTLHSTRGDRAR